MGIGKNFYLNLSVTIGNVLFPIINLPVVLRVLGPDNFGQSQFILSLAIYFSTFAAFGVPLYGISQVAKAQSKLNLDKVCSELIFIQILTGFISFVLYISVIFYITDINDKFILAAITSPIILANFLNVEWYLTGLQDFKTIAKRAFFIKILSTLFIFFLPFSNTPVALYVTIVVFSYVGNYIINFYIFLKRQRIIVNNLNLARHLPHISFILLTLLVGMIYTTLDNVLIGIFSTHAEIGFYNVGSKIVKLIIPLIVSFGGTLIPKIAFESIKEDKEKMNSLLSLSYNFIIYFSIPTAIFLLLSKNEIVQLIGGDEYIQSSKIVLILCVLPVIIGLGHLLSYQILIPINKSFGSSIAAISGGIVFLSIGFILIPKYGSIGCAISVLITEFFVTVIYFIFIPRVFYKIFKVRPIIQALISSLIFFPIFYILKFLNLNYIILLILTALFIILFYNLIQYFIFKNRNIIHVLLKRNIENEQK